MWISEFKDYKAFLKALLKTYPKAGRGQSARLAKHLNVAPIVVSQVLAGDRHFTIDQGLKVSQFFGLDEMATEYFMLSINHARAETRETKSYFEKKMSKLKVEADKLKSNIDAKQTLSDSDMGVFYSSWYYAGISCLVSVPGFQTVDQIAEYFGMSRTRVRDAVSFMVATGVLREEGGKILPGQTKTLVTEPSPHVHNHRRNWRLKAIESSIKVTEDQIMISGPVSISKKDADMVRRELMQFINKFSKLVGPSKEEKVMCLNLDWFNF